jgi:hypothetical protein
MDTCGILTHYRDMIGGSKNPCECLRPRNHDDPHLIQRDDGTYVAYRTDWECDCSMCQSDNPDDWCEIYWKVSEEEAKKLISSIKLG